MDNNFFGGFDAPAFKIGPTTKPKPGAKGKKGSGNQSYISSLISEGGGFAGAAGGAAAGAAIGSVVPVVGTAIGGLIGAGIGGFAGGTGGRLVENKVRDNEWRPGDAFEEGAWSGLLAPGVGNIAKLAKGGTAALAAKGGTKTLESALVEAGQQSAKAPLKTSASGKMMNAGNNMLASQYGTLGKNVARETDPIETIGKLANFGIIKPQDAERLSMAVTGSDGIINQAVLKATGGAGRVPTGNIPKVLQDALDDIGLVENDAKSVSAIVKAQMGRLGKGADADPKQVLGVMKSLEQRAADLRGKGGNYKMADPVREDKAKALLRVRNELQEQLYTTAGGNANLATVLTPELREHLVNLKPKDTKWQKFVDDDVMQSKDIGSLRSTMAPFVNVSKMIDEGEINSMTAGGRFGNWLESGGQGGIAGPLAALGAATLKNPASRVAGQALRKAGSTADTPLATPGNKAIAGRLGLAGGVEAGGAATFGMRGANPMLAAGMVGEPQGMETDMSQGNAPASLEQALLSGSEGPNPLNPYAQPEDMGQQESMPYSKDNLLADIQRDPKNAGEYIAYYQKLAEIFDPELEEGEGMNADTQKAMNQMSNGSFAIDQLQQQLDSVAGSGKVGGGIADFLGRHNLSDNAKGYNDMASGSVTTLARALGETGVISEGDAKIYGNMLPKITDSPALRADKWVRIRQRIAHAQGNIRQNGAGSQEEEPTDLAGAMMRSQGYR